MKAFIDTSALIKKYVVEKGSAEFDLHLEKIREIVTAPTYWIELNAAIQRKLREKVLSPSEASRIQKEAEKDLDFLNRIVWNERLEIKAVEMVHKYSLKTLDGIQLAAGVLAKADIFITSDRNLYDFAAKELNRAALV